MRYRLRVAVLSKFSRKLSRGILLTQRRPHFMYFSIRTKTSRQLLVVAHWLATGKKATSLKIDKLIRSDHSNHHFYLYLYHRWVITAAHCVDGESDLGLVAGGVGDGQYSVGFRIPLANQFIHPDYDTTTHINDIGLYLITIAFRSFSKKCAFEYLISPLLFHPHTFCVLFINQLWLNCPTTLSEIIICSQQNCQLIVAKISIIRRWLLPAQAKSLSFLTPRWTWNCNMRSSKRWMIKFATNLPFNLMQYMERKFALILMMDNLFSRVIQVCLRNNQFWGLSRFIYPIAFNFCALSGGPLIKQEDSTLIGITSYVQFKTWALFRKDPINLQIFTKIHYYFDWISEKTGIELPECEPPLYIPPPPPSTPTPPSSKKTPFWSWFGDLFKNKHWVKNRNIFNARRERKSNFGLFMNWQFFYVFVRQ